MPVIPVDRVVDKKSMIRKMAGRAGGEAKVVADPKNMQLFYFNFISQ
jgi:hypothetical protein